MGNERASHELEIFRRFAVAAGLSTSLQCGEKRKWPEPDVLFQDSDGAQIAFELVELCDQGQRRGIGILVDTKTALQKHYENLPNKKKLLFEQKFGNACLYFRFPVPLTFKRRKAVFVSIFDRLLDLPDGFTGEAFEGTAAIAGLLNGVSVSRDVKGPIFDAESFVRVGDPTVHTMAQKFAKHYNTPHPIELLAHIETNPMFPDEVWIANLEKFLAAQPRPLPFSRIWIFHVGKNEVKFCYDDLTQI